MAPIKNLPTKIGDLEDAVFLCRITKKTFRLEFKLEWIGKAGEWLTGKWQIIKLLFNNPNS